MKYKIEELKDITDSIEIMQNHPNSFSKYMFYIIGLLLILATTWSIFAQKYIVITATGEIRPKGEICDIYTRTNGTIINTNIKDGQLVKEGDILISFDNNTIIKAQCDGIISLIQDINVGDFIQNGIEIAKIIPSNQTQKKVNLYINNEDILNIKQGQDVSLEILSLPQTEYGAIKTTLENISNDAKSSNGNNYYTATCSLDTINIKDIKGNSLDIKNGMMVKARIINRQVSYFKYFLEKINILN
ncbi:HlyD family secretion protein [Clostridium saccharobutylicum]|uniref:HlyD family efflux transporter periplasmic adaptor subunit n=1 Tax=Clostridium saccharobutylicum TaxID=169679 RepID=UPI000983AAEA|nr:HlyD family efflux transporter periplasmic adaptor subunit [Clostridium saccharobutylicum]AQS08226.1 HlyD family secretion protein [Clostridium saccharobutylicum]NSB89048.1 multidrug resistance efflux pump [Clostridium saccharobutylicum]NYC29452.1 multidrug resistance efflux pump [Clostridium saccharobutylicum]OOM11539.1 HlyD family secretion protein [Clostridium saccharobutylicum]